MTPIALVGYGKMGRLLAQLAPESGLEVKLIVDEAQGHPAPESWQGIAAAIEFTTPEAVVPTLLKLAAAGVPTVDLPMRSLRPATLAGIVAAARRHRVRLIHSHGKGAGLYGRLAAALTGVPAVHTFHGLHHRGHGRVGQRGLGNRLGNQRTGNRRRIAGRRLCRVDSRFRRGGVRHAELGGLAHVYRMPSRAERFPLTSEHADVWSRSRVPRAALLSSQRAAAACRRSGARRVS